MRNQLKTLYSALLIVAAFGATSTVHGVPAFARQTGLDCNSCHAAPGYPTLNSFGQAFKAAGYTQGNDDDMLGDGEALSIPKNLNFSLVYKARLPFESAGGTSTLNLQVPDEIAFLVGGRLGKNIGWLAEAGGTALDFASMKVVFAPEVGPVRIGIVPWFSDLTPAYFFENLSTGAVRNIRSWENRKLISAMNAVNYGAVDDAAGGGQGTNTMNSGLGLYVWHSLGYVAFTPFMAGHDNDMLTAPIGYYSRLAVTPSFGPVEMAVGVQYYAGSYADSTAVSGTNTLSTLGVDAQAIIALGNNPISVFVTYANDLNNLKSALTIAAEIAVVQDVLSAGLAFRTGLSTMDDEIGAMVKWQIVRNMKLEVDFMYNLTAGDIQLMPLLFGAF